MDYATCRRKSGPRRARLGLESFLLSSSTTGLVLKIFEPDYYRPFLFSAPGIKTMKRSPTVRVEAGHDPRESELGSYDCNVRRRRFGTLEDIRLCGTTRVLTETPEINPSGLGGPRVARVSFTTTDDLRAHGSFIYLLEIPLQVHHLGSLMLATIVFPYLVNFAPNVQSQGPLEMNVANKPQLPLMTRMLADTVPGMREIGSRVDKVISVTG